ncbi:MAG: tetratricopeptide repeat protein [Candidatus Binatia bacterium]
MKRSVVYGFSLLLLLSACETEAIRRQQEEIRRQEAEIKKLRQEIEDEAAARKKEEQRTQDCASAFRYFERAQGVEDPRNAVVLYREGLNLCPDDDVAHYELGKIFAGMGKRDEARAEFEAALKINPNFQGAKQERENLLKK